LKIQKIQKSAPPYSEACPCNIVVYAGSNKKFKGLQYKVNKVAIHPKYDGYANASANDIALLTLERSLTFTDNIGPACLPNKSSEEYVGQGLTISGWVVTEDDGEEPAAYLQVVKDIKILEDCKE
jgi:hypothetical protein